MNALLAEASQVGTDISSALSTIKESMLADLTPANIAAIVAAVVGGSIGLVLLWFGVRKLIGAIQNAFAHGRISV